MPAMNATLIGFATRCAAVASRVGQAVVIVCHHAPQGFTGKLDLLAPVEARPKGSRKRRDGSRFGRASDFRAKQCRNLHWRRANHALAEARQRRGRSSLDRMPASPLCSLWFPSQALLERVLRRPHDPADRRRIDPPEAKSVWHGSTHRPAGTEESFLACSSSSRCWARMQVHWQPDVQVSEAPINEVERVVADGLDRRRIVANSTVRPRRSREAIADSARSPRQTDRRERRTQQARSESCLTPHAADDHGNR